MYYPTLLVKADSINLKIIDLSSRVEAEIDQEALNRLISVTSKEDCSSCSKEEVEFLSALEECMELTARAGVGNLAIKTGDFENLDIYLANTCNLFCRHCCFFEKGKPADKRHIDYDLLQRTIIEAEEMGLYKLKLCGGEPLTYYRIKELFSFLNTRMISTTVITNGLLLDDFLGSLDHTKLAFVVSLDGFEHSHDYLRGTGTFAKTKKNIESAISAGFDVTINTVVYKRNVNEVEAFTAFVQDMGVSKLSIQVIRPVGQADLNLRSSLITDEAFLRKMHQNELDDQLQKISKGLDFCTSCKTGLTIDFNHNVIGCPFISEEPIGNLAEEGLKTIHERSLRDNPLFNVEELADCLSCELFNVRCAGGCRARAKRMTGSLYACDHWIPFLLDHPKFKESPHQAWEFLLI